MKASLILGFAMSLLFSSPAMAVCGVTNVFTNGTTADATQVNTNFADVIGCFNFPRYYSGSVTYVSATSTPGAMGGLGSSTTLTPTSTGRVRIQITGWTTGGSTSTIVGITPRYGTGTAPASGAGLTGTIASPEIRNTGNSTGSTGTSFSLYAEVTGMTLNVPYWFDIATANGLGGSFSVAVTTRMIEEF